MTAPTNRKLSTTADSTYGNSYFAACRDFAARCSLLSLVVLKHGREKAKKGLKKAANFTD